MAIQRGCVSVTSLVLWMRRTGLLRCARNDGGVVLALTGGGARDDEGGFGCALGVN